MLYLTTERQSQAGQDDAARRVAVLFAGRGVAPRLQTAAGMLPRRALPPAKIPRNAACEGFSTAC